MTLTIANDCSTATITSTYLDSQNQSVVVNMTLNCKTEYSAEIDVDDTTIIVTPEDFGIDNEKFVDSVYYFKVVVTQEDGTKVEEGLCTFINCSSNCDMLTTFKEVVGGNKNSIIKALSYHALILAQSCGSCACEDLCTLYNATTLDNCDTHDSGCGCS